jgi:hypothetical protein
MSYYQTQMSNKVPVSGEEGGYTEFEVLEIVRGVMKEITGKR